MAHFALIDETNTVKEVIVVSNENCAGGEFPDSEVPGQAFIAQCGLTGTWLQTSYHAAFRGTYAAIGGKYNSETDEFEAA